MSGLERRLGLRRYRPGIHVMGTNVMDRNNRAGRRERFEILKIAQDLGKGTVAVDKGSTGNGVADRGEFHGAYQISRGRC